jgi:hypothetical protein
MATQVKWDTRQFDARMKEWQRKLQVGYAKGIANALGALLDDCTIEPPTTPVKTGTLRGSGSYFVNNKLIATTEEAAAGHPAAMPTPATTDSVTLDPNKVIGRAGFNTSYAKKVHEVPMNFQEPEAGNKYMEAKMRTHGADYIKTAANVAKAEVGM